jgi:protoporphyrinogen oxidase
MTTSGRPLTKPTGGSPKCEVRIPKFSQFDSRNSSFGIPIAPVTLNWLTSRKSLFAGCSQSVTRNRSVFCPPLAVPVGIAPVAGGTARGDQVALIKQEGLVRRRVTDYARHWAACWIGNQIIRVRNEPGCRVASTRRRLAVRVLCRIHSTNATARRLREHVMPKSANTEALVPIRSTKLAILGGGPGGLAAGYFARKADLPFCIYEAQTRVGGNAITFQEGEFRFDSGAHRWHDKDAEMTAEVRRLLGADLLQCSLPSQIYHEGCWVDFPLSPLSLLGALGVWTCFNGALDVLRARLSAADEFSHFEHHAVRKYGREFARRFLLSYSEKLWGLPCRQLSPGISGSRLKGLDLTTFVFEAVGNQRAKTRHLDGSFLYPRLGFGMIAEKLAEACGLECVRLNTKITRIFHNARRVEAIELNGREIMPVDEVISTLPLPLWLRLMQPLPDPALLELAASLRFRNLVLVAIFLRKPQISENGSVYFPDPEFPMTRVYEPKNRSRDMAPPDKTMLTAEIPCAMEDAVWRGPDASLIAQVQARLTDIGWFRPHEVLGGCVKRLPFAYPVLELGFEDKVRRLQAGLSVLENVQFAGRNGRFQYTHMHDMLRFGKDAVARLHTAGQAA